MPICFYRTKALGPVQDIDTATVNERELLFALHLDGSLRVWDISSHTKLLNYNVHSNDFEGNLCSEFICCMEDQRSPAELSFMLYGSLKELVFTVLHYVHCM
jgi:nuclear pore complex protein Nup160